MPPISIPRSVVAASRRPVAAACALLCATATCALAQAPVQAPPLALSTTVPEDALSSLPSTNGFSLLETMQSEVIADRIDTGGLSTGDPSRIGAHGSSWTQTFFRVGDVDITDPDGSGTPLLIPAAFQWQRIEIATGVMPIDVNSSGVAVTLVPRRPASTWTGGLESSMTRPEMTAGRALRSPPAIARLDSWTNGSLFISGPLVPNRVGLVLASSWTGSTRFERVSPLRLSADDRSVFAHLVFTPTAHDEVDVVGWGQGTTFPSPGRAALGPLAAESDLAVHLQSTWKRTVADGLSWRVFTGLSDRQRTPDVQAAGAVAVERLLDGPVADLASIARGGDRTLTIGARLAPQRFTLGGEHTAVVGLDLTGASAHRTSAFAGRVGESVAGQPARVWVFGPSNGESDWSSTTFAAFVSDRVPLLPRVTLGLGLRFEAASGSAAGAANGISWRNWFPRGDLRWEITDYWHIAAVTTFSRSGYRLPLGWLAYGDPASPTGTVYRWNATDGTVPPQPSQMGTLVSRVGPGTGGNPNFSRIDPELRRPFTDEVVFGFESRPGLGTIVRLTAMARREHDMVGLVDVGVPFSSYSSFLLPDPGYGPADPQVLPVFNRAPSTFGADRYLLTNPANDEATYVGVDISAQTSSGPLFLLISGTAGRSEGLAANIGYLASENDQGLIGDVFTNPNSRTLAQGRLFTERGYTLKLSGSYALPEDVHVGVIARYQDGQHFSRVVVVDNLNQGPEAVRAFRNGRTRFTYTLTVDAQLQKGFTIGGQRIELIAGGYNLLNTANEVEELDAVAPALRIASSVQPPRAFRVGLRFAF